MVFAQAEKFAFHIVIVGKAVITPGGVEHPVADVYQIQKPSEFFFCQFDLHSNASFISDGTYYSTETYYFHTENVNK